MITNKTALRTALVAGVSFLTMAGAANAQTTSAADAEARIAALEAQLEALSGQIADLKAATAASLKDVRSTQSATTVNLANGRPTISTGDGAFTASFRGIFQIDAGYYDQPAPWPPTSVAARSTTRSRTSTPAT
jgi:phosphate-selective porin OprO/OprP